MGEPEGCREGAGIAEVADSSLIVVLPATSVDGGEVVLRLVRALTRLGCSVAVLVLRSSDDDAVFGRWTRLNSGRRLSSPVIAAVASRAGRRPRQALRRWGLRRWLAARPASGMVIGHPSAAGVVAFDKVDRPVVAMLPTPALRPNDLVSGQVRALRSARGWLVADEVQAEQVRSGFGRPVVVTGALFDGSDLPRVQRKVGGPIVLLPDPGQWEKVDHVVEVASKLIDLGVELRWVVHDSDDQWLARHDVDHLGQPSTIHLVDANHPELLIGPSVVVRTGYDALDSRLAFAARQGGLPVLGFTSDASAVEPFDVESLVEQVVRMHRSPSVDDDGVSPLPRPCHPSDAAQEILDWMSLSDASRPSPS